ncbi:hypothetical protein D1AOALGA4SA_7679 [Olavius algarvensis Delta 1 endosymbiont]|nr:hypothetical protein D1AOALGA4SA_7679 [Olavius algarvensis Delta 1 endosymbiont]
MSNGPLEIDRAQRFRKSAIRNLKSQIITRRRNKNGINYQK